MLLGTALLTLCWGLIAAGIRSFDGQPLRWTITVGVPVAQFLAVSTIPVVRETRLSDRRRQPRRAVRACRRDPERPIRFGDVRIHATVSIGVGHIRPTDSTIDTAIAAADAALYEAKSAGRNRVRPGETHRG